MSCNNLRLLLLKQLQNFLQICNILLVICIYYNFCIQAGAWSEPLEVRSGNAPPDAPGAPQCTPRPGQVMGCVWSEPRNNGAPITDYRLEMGHGSTPTFTTVYQGVQPSCDVKSIPPASLCLFRVQVGVPYAYYGRCSSSSL